MPEGETKTILMPIYHGMRARSIFYTDIYEELASDKNVKIVVAAPESKIEFYKERFKEPNVIFERCDLDPEPEFGRILNRIAFNLLPTSTVRGKHWLYYYRYGNYFKFLFLNIANRILGPLPFTRALIRFLDTFVPLDKEAERLLKKYRPDLVIAPDVVSPPDRIFSRAAKRMGYPIIAMARSWDNLTSKGFVQTLPNKLIVYTDRMIEEAKKIVGMRSENIIMTGPPQFDIYYKKNQITRDSFLRSLGIDPACKIILCAPFFDRYTGSAVIMINHILKSIETGFLPKNTHVLVRYRPGSPPIDGGELQKSGRLTVTAPSVRMFAGKDRISTTEDFEWGREDVELLRNSLEFSDVVINTVSTLSVDAAAFDKPVINIRFDADPNCPPHHSVLTMLPNHDHYRAIEVSGGVRLVSSMEELIFAIDAYLKNPRLDSEGRERLRREQIVLLDGRAGKRIAEFIKKELGLPVSV